MSATQDLYDFAGRYRIALKDDKPILDEDKPHMSALINLCIPGIPARLHSEIYTPMCCFAVCLGAKKSFIIHVAFIQHDLIIKYRMESPCQGSCSFYKLREDKVPKDIRVSAIKEDLGGNDEEWCIVSSKDRDVVLMPAPPSRTHK